MKILANNKLIVPLPQFHIWAMEHVCSIAESSTSQADGAGGNSVVNTMSVVPFKIKIMNF